MLIIVLWSCALIVPQESRLASCAVEMEAGVACRVVRQAQEEACGFIRTGFLLARFNGSERGFSFFSKATDSQFCSFDLRQTLVFPLSAFHLRTLKVVRCYAFPRNKTTETYFYFMFIASRWSQPTVETFWPHFNCIFDYFFHPYDSFGASQVCRLTNELKWIYYSLFQIFRGRRLQVYMLGDWMNSLSHSQWTNQMLALARGIHLVRVLVSASLRYTAAFLLNSRGSGIKWQRLPVCLWMWKWHPGLSDKI